MRQITSHELDGLPVNVEVSAEDPPDSDGLNHLYMVIWHEGDVECELEVLFQEGDPLDGVNGMTDEALLAILVDRVRNVQRSKLKSDHKERALVHLGAALTMLKTDSNDRILRGVYGKSIA